MPNTIGSDTFNYSPYLIKDKTLRDRIDLKEYVTDRLGMPTLTDILQELAKPGRDPREKFEPVKFTEGVNTISDLEVGMKLTGIVTNITAFGAFVDLGVHQDGLVHISQLADKFVSDPADIVKVAQKVEVTVLEVDIPRSRIALSMKKEPAARSASAGTKSKMQVARAGIKPKQKTKPQKQQTPTVDPNKSLSSQLKLGW